MLRYECYAFQELSLELLYRILALRQEVFVVEQNCPYLDADDKDQPGWHLCGFSAQNELVAYVRLLPAGISYPDYVSIGRVITAMSIRRRGAGHQLMEMAIDWAHEQWPGQPIKISAQCHLTAFYEALGFKSQGESYLEDDIPHIAMRRPAGPSKMQSLT